MKLFGLIECFTVSIIGTRIVPIQHPDLFKYLEDNCKGASAGLEIASENEIIELSPVVFNQQKIHLDLYNWFKSRNNRTHFLESKGHLEKEAGFVRKFLAIEKEMKKESNAEQAAELMRSAFKFRVEAEYEKMVGKEQAILENIAKYKPDLVFVGAAHSASFYKQRERLREKYGIVIDEYWEDKIIKSPSERDIMMAMSCSSEHVPMERYLEDKIEVEMKKIENPADVLDDPETAYIERLYKAVREGRITDKKPDYIGTWDTDLEPQGLFEMHIAKSSPTEGGTNVEGTIEDCMGSAEFSGKLEPKGITFVKRYCKNITYNVGSITTDPITYSGFLKGNEFVGTYQGVHCGMGNFKMKKVA